MMRWRTPKTTSDRDSAGGGAFPAKERNSFLVLGLALSLATTFAYLRVFQAGFVYDDGAYLLPNPYVTGGLTWKGIRWAFTTLLAGNWYPLTWLSHMFDAQIFGMHPRGHHMTSLLLHVLITLSLFSLLRQMIGGTWRSFFVAALFALHPLHVESVAWISERKDVLSTLFFVLALKAWWSYARRPGVRKYIPALALFTLGMMSKSMLVTFPCVLLLLDWWPLGRLRLGGGRGGLRTAAPLILEKMPLFILSAAFSVLTFLAQRESGSVGSLVAYPLWVRTANAALVYLRYIFKMIVPRDLSVFYPYPDTSALPWWQVISSVIVLAGISTLAIRTARRAPYFAMGWSWYLGTLIPVIGFVKVGAHAMADRYTYIPSIGLFIILVCGMDILIGGARRLLFAATAGMAIALLALGAATWTQVGYWRDGGTLFTHALATTQDNWLAHYNYGLWLAWQKRPGEAAPEFAAALRLQPYLAVAHYDLAIALIQLGRQEEAISELRESIRLGPGPVDAHTPLANLLTDARRYEEALSTYAEAVRISPSNAQVLVNYGAALARMGKLEEALRQYRKAARISPDMPEACMNMGNVISDLGRDAEAIGWYERALQLRPAYAEAHYNLGLTLERLGRRQEAIARYRQSLQIDPRFSAARSAQERLRKDGL